MDEEKKKPLFPQPNNFGFSKLNLSCVRVMLKWQIAPNAILWSRCPFPQVGRINGYPSKMSGSNGSGDGSLTHFCKCRLHNCKITKY